MNEFFKQIWQIIVESNLLNVTGAILVLLVGYLVALTLGRKTRNLIQKIAAKTVTLPDGSEIVPITRTARISGRIIYGIIMLLAVLGCFSILKLNAAAVPLQEFISKITAFLPNIAGALLLLFTAWVIAELVKMFCSSFMQNVFIYDKLPKDAAEKVKSEKFIRNVTQTAGCVVYLFFLPAILNALKIYGVTKPLQSMFEEFLTFIPNLAAAAVILLVGLWAANLARKAARGMTVISKISEIAGKTADSEKLFHGSIAAAVGWIVYILIALPVAVAALSALDIEVLSRAVAGFFGEVLAVSGEIAVSAVLFAAVWGFGKFIGRLVERFTAAWGLDILCCNLCSKNEKRESVKFSTVAGKITVAALWVLTAVAVCDILELEKLSSLIRRFAVFGGNIILSCVVLLIGVKLADIASMMVKDKFNRTVEYAVKAVVIIFTVALAISNLKLGGSIVETAFALLLGAVAVACAVAFGIGGKAVAGRLLEEWLEKIKK